MDLRRGGEFAFGSAVFLCGGALLVLAVGRLSAPVVGVSVASAPIATAAVVSVTARPIVLSTIARIAMGSRIAHRREPVTKFVRVLKPEPKPTPQIAAAPVAAKTAVPATHFVRATDAPRVAAPIAIARKPAARAPRHRYGIAYVRVRPSVERTPEPPIGYDDHPTLLRSDGPSDPTPTMAPVQVELETTHLGH